MRSFTTCSFSKDVWGFSVTKEVWQYTSQSLLPSPPPESAIIGTGDLSLCVCVCVCVWACVYVSVSVCVTMRVRANVCCVCVCVCVCMHVRVPSTSPSSGNLHFPNLDTTGGRGREGKRNGKGVGKRTHSAVRDDVFDRRMFVIDVSATSLYVHYVPIDVFTTGLYVFATCLYVAHIFRKHVNQCVLLQQNMFSYFKPWHTFNKQQKRRLTARVASTPPIFFISMSIRMRSTWFVSHFPPIIMSIRMSSISTFKLSQGSRTSRPSLPASSPV